MLIRTAAAVLAILLALPTQAQETTPIEADTATSDATAETSEAAAEPVAEMSMGAEDAPLTIIEYASFTCGHCANFHTENWSKLKSEYIDTGKVRFIQRDVYFDAVGLWAGILARCGGDDRYFAVSDLLFDEQQQWLTGNSGEEYAANLRKIGLKSGLTEDQITACWNDSAKAESLIADFQKNASADDIQATPTFIIGEEKIQNVPWDELKAKIDDKLAEAM